jgi:hypothetical protein
MGDDFSGFTDSSGVHTGPGPTLTLTFTETLLVWEKQLNFATEEKL